MEEARSEIEFLPDEVLLMIFRFLSFRDLQLAEQVCERWKAVVETRFATVKILDMSDSHGESDCVKLVKRCGPSVQTLFMSEWSWWNKQLHWTKYIAEAFINLKSLSLTYLIIEEEDLRNLSVKCRQLKSISFYGCIFSDEGHLGCNLEYLKMTCWGNEITKAGLSLLFSKCKKVKTLELNGDYDCDEDFSNWCREKVSVQKLLIGHSPMTKLSFSQMSRLSLLEELELNDCAAVDSDTLIDISRGCLNLRRVVLHQLPNICDRGVKSLSGCRNLSEFICSRCTGVTEESLVQLSKSGRLKQIRICDSWVSNGTCAAIVGHCPQLEELCVTLCKGVMDGIVDTAIAAIENRANGVVLHLYIEYTGVDQEKAIRTHPLLRVYRNQESIDNYLKSVDRITF